MQLFRDIVVAEDGHTYERETIVEWIKKNGRSTLTDQPLPLERFYPNYAMKTVIDQFENSMKAKRNSILLMLTLNEDLSRHPHIVRTYGLVYENNSIMLLQEHAPLGSLFDFLQDQLESPKEKILIEIFLQIVDAMIFLAFNNVVHADLAYRNILFKTTLNIIPVRCVAPEILSKHMTSDDYTEKSDVYSMGILMWEAYNRGIIPWSKISNDDEVVRRVLNGELLPKPSNCSDDCWSVVCKMWAKAPKDRPTFAELKHLLAEQSFCSSSLNTLLTQLLSRTTLEFGTVEREVINGWPNEYRQKNQDTNNSFGQIRNMRRKNVLDGMELHPIVEMVNARIPILIDVGERQLIWPLEALLATLIMEVHNLKCTMELLKEKYKRFRLGSSSIASIPTLLTMFKHDTANFSRDYYISPVEYILSYNNVVAQPVYIVVYSVKSEDIQIRSTTGNYCSFHKEYHICSTGCDGHYGPECLGSDQGFDTTNCNGISRDLYDCGLIGLNPEFLQKLAAGNI
ncbi:unnamed protein product [Adineta ricciae]|nr:unnamed protein product [Adineta ricciae]